MWPAIPPGRPRRYSAARAARCSRGCIVADGAWRSCWPRRGGGMDSHDRMLAAFGAGGPGVGGGPGGGWALLRGGGGRGGGRGGGGGPARAREAVAPPARPRGARGASGTGMAWSARLGTVQLYCVNGRQSELVAAPVPAAELARLAARLPRA